MKIMGVKVGLSQNNMPAPLNYRKFLNVFIITFSPAISSFVVGLPISYKTSTYILLSLTFVTAMLKGIGQLMGNGQVYAPTNEAVEKKQDAVMDAKVIIWVVLCSGFFYSL